MYIPTAYEPHLVSANRWMAKILEDLDLPPADSARGLRALRAGLHAIRDRLPAVEVVDLGAQLPVLIRGLWYEGWSLHHDIGDMRTPNAMLARVAKDLAHDSRLDPVDVLRAVVHQLVARVSAGEIRDVVATLPKSLEHLWNDLRAEAPARSL